MANKKCFGLDCDQFGHVFLSQMQILYKIDNAMKGKECHPRETRATLIQKQMLKKAILNHWACFLNQAKDCVVKI